MRFIITYLCFLICLSANGQNSSVSKDFQWWNSLNVEKAINKKTSFSLRHDIRFKQNASKLKSYFIQLGAEREISKLIDAGLDFRLSNYAGQSKYRVSPSLVFGKRIKKLRLSLKFRTRIDHNIEDQETQTNWRNRMMLSYRIKKSKFRPSIGLEVFHSDDNQFAHVVKFRYISKLRYEINNDLKINIGYLIQDEKNVESPERDFITQLSLTYQID